MSAGERGSGSVLTVAIVASVALFAMAVIPAGAVLSRRQAVAGASDAAALAAADARSGAIAGHPCDLAERVARANAARVASCELDGLVATVSATGTVGPFRITTRSTAGPPREPSGPRAAHPRAGAD